MLVTRCRRRQFGPVPLLSHRVETRLAGVCANSATDLPQRCLVRRKVCAENRRKVDIFITEKGLDILDKIDPVLVTTENAITSSLSEKEMEQLLQLLTKIKS